NDPRNQSRAISSLFAGREQLLVEQQQRAEAAVSADQQLAGGERQVEQEVNQEHSTFPPMLPDEQWAWVPVPDPSDFPQSSPPSTLQLAPRLTGNTHTWWPIPAGQQTLEGEQRFRMVRAAAPGLESRAIYF